jgi:hypothetical protein
MDVQFLLLPWVRHRVCGGASMTRNQYEGLLIALSFTAGLFVGLIIAAAINSA